MGRGITSVVQPLDKLLSKIFKVYYRKFYDFYILTAPLIDKGFPVPPSWQLISIQVFDAWDQVPEALVYKQFIVCGYKDPYSTVNDEHCDAIIEADTNRYRHHKLVKLVTQYTGDKLGKYLLHDDDEFDSSYDFDRNNLDKDDSDKDHQD